MRRIIIVTFASLAACHGSDDPSGPDAGVDPDADTTDEVQLSTWTRCSLAPGANDGRAECATADVPLDWDRPDGRRISLSLKRLPAGEPETGQYWILDGGPGYSAVSDMAIFVGDLASDRPDLAYYVVDHRGVGGSTRLACDVEEADGDVTTEELPSCIEHLQNTWGDDLAQFTTTPAAQDIGELVNRLRPAGEQLFVYGASYGSYLAQRYLQLFPDQPDGVILEGILPPDLGVMTYDAEMNAAGLQLMARCAHDASCSDHFGGSNPRDVAAGLPDLLEGGHCPELGTTRDAFRQILGALLFSEPLRDLVPAVVFRLARCAPDDVAAIQQLTETLQSAFGGGSLGLPLNRNITTNELWSEDAPTPSEALAAWRETVMSTGYAKDIASANEVWPSFANDEYVGRYSDYRGPMLMLQGGLDPATPPFPAMEVRDHYTATNQTWAFFPDAPHIVVQGPGHPCGHGIVLQFLEKPTSPLELGCIEEIDSIRFDGDPSYNMYLLGTADAWGD